MFVSYIVACFINRNVIKQPSYHLNTLYNFGVLGVGK